MTNDIRVPLIEGPFAWLRVTRQANDICLSLEHDYDITGASLCFHPDDASAVAAAIAPTPPPVDDGVTETIAMLHALNERIGWWVANPDRPYRYKLIELCDAIDAIERRLSALTPPISRVAGQGGARRLPDGTWEFDNVDQRESAENEAAAWHDAQDMADLAAEATTEAAILDDLYVSRGINVPYRRARLTVDRLRDLAARLTAGTEQGEGQ